MPKTGFELDTRQFSRSLRRLTRLSRKSAGEELRTAARGFVRKAVDVRGSILQISRFLGLWDGCVSVIPLRCRSHAEKPSLLDHPKPDFHLALPFPG
jgi:hypothetical protein